MNSTRTKVYLISYDIADDKCRTRIADVLEQYGYERLQYSVFIGPLRSKNVEPLWKELAALVQPEEFPADRLIVIPLDIALLKKSMLLGAEMLDWSYICGETKAIVF